MERGNHRKRGGGMDYFAQQFINGVSLGAIYGLIAIGYTMVYGIIGMINFAHGEIYMIGAFIALMVMVAFGIGESGLVIVALLSALLVSMALTSLYGWVLERVAYRPLRGSQRLAALISAIGMSIALQNYVQLTQGARVKTLPPIIRGGFEFQFGDTDFLVRLSNLQILIISLTLLLMAVFALLIARTALGRAQRASRTRAWRPCSASTWTEPSR